MSGGNSIKSHKKKSSSIDKKGGSQIQNHSEIIKKSLPKKGAHKKSKSYINHNMEEGQENSQAYYHKNPNSSGFGNQAHHGMVTLDNSFMKNSMNKSYERLLADTIEAQNSSSGGYHHAQNNQYQQYQKVVAQYAAGSSTKPHQQQQHNMTLQFSSSNNKRAAGSANVSQTRLNQESYDVAVINKAQHSHLSQNGSKSNHNSHKNSKYDQQSRKKSRRTDHLYLSSNNRTKAESNRTSKKNSPVNNTIATSGAKNQLHIREAKTKPTSPERSLMLMQGGYKNYQHPAKSKPTSTTNSNNIFISGSQLVNEREQRQALNMITNINNKKQDMLIISTQSTGPGHSSQLSQQQKTSSTNPHQRQDFNSIQQNSQKRKNFKNMFYSPKGNRDSFTEPHSKVVSQAQTKDNSPLRLIGREDHSYNNQMPSVQHPHHPQIRTSAKPPTQIKSKGIYNVNNKYMAQDRTVDLEGCLGGNSFMEESYMKNTTSGAQYPTTQARIGRDEISFESSNQFSQTGTPITYTVGKHQKAQSQIPASIEKKSNKLVISGGHPSKLLKNQSQAPSPQNKLTIGTNSGQKNPQKIRFQSEAPSPANYKYKNQQIQNEHPRDLKKRGQSISCVQPMPDDLTTDSFTQSQNKVVMTFKGKPLIVQNNQNAKQIGKQQQQQNQNQNQQQFLFNQYIKSKKQRYNKYESQEGSLERPQDIYFQSKSQVQASKSQEKSSSQQSNHAQSPRFKEVSLIQSLIKECFEKHGKPPKTQLELYKIGKMLGKGAFGKVNLGLHRLTRKLVAIKSINMEFMKDESSKKKMSNEISILKMLRHPSIVKMLETFDIDKHHLIVMELCPGGDLLNYVRKRRKLNEKYAKFVFKQIMEGLAYCHDNGIVHRDIKLDNILLDGHGNIKIGDFGVSRKTIDNEILFEQCGTPAYIAPEIVRELGYKGYPVDIWSAGVCLYAMLYGNVPFKANQMGDLNKMILDSEIEYKETASPEARDLMQRMLQKNPNKRLTADETLDHPWFDDVDEHIDIFDEQELDLIKKEFTYVSQKAKLKELKSRQADDLNTEFTEHSINTTENELLKNNSSRSVILCPFNTQAGQAAKSIYEEVCDMLIDKDMAIRFNVRVRELDRQYEKFNNQDFDNGVYHKYAYNQGKKPEDGKGDEGLKEETIERDEVDTKGLVRKRQKAKPDINQSNYYMKLDEKIINRVEEFGFPRDYIEDLKTQQKWAIAISKLKKTKKLSLQLRRITSSFNSRSEEEVSVKYGELKRKKKRGLRYEGNVEGKSHVKEERDICDE